MLDAIKTPLQTQWQASALGRRWRAIPSRDRMALLGLGLFLGLVLLYLLLWLPAERRLASARDYFETQRGLHAYLQLHAPQARTVQSQPQSQVDPERLQGLVTATAAEQGLAVERIDSDAPGAVQVNLQPAAFPVLLRWFGVLEGQGVRIDEAGLDRSEDGRVTARVSLKVGG
ncbi:type II secretion system protein GspM [Pseudomonas sp. TCU-HL1]|uniref:type II secretion system protein GspM n=1 Tax=Pseudomonas sp. TCU-HL1 TaxID=1856685 RepID=UPI0008588696|nr:type II secretion system protein GspM [Pseudomonas sp. TCU-HL1]AOE84590.1 general secretion pathway protein GspM [Pseudomonas sp. TCU-HL1]